MNKKSFKSVLSGKISVPASKSHTIRSLIFASFADGKSFIRNPLPSADCQSAAAAVKLFGAGVTFEDDLWTVEGCGGKIRVPEVTVDVGNSGSTLYFLSPVAATLEGETVFTGDSSICSRPVDFLADAVRQMGSDAKCDGKDGKTCPIHIYGKNLKAFKVSTDGAFSQYISGMMMAASRVEGETVLSLSNPMETPYLHMTEVWLKSLGVDVKLSSDFKDIRVKGPCPIKAFDRTIPSDWSAVAFPLVAAVITGSGLEIVNVDGSGTQGDAAIVDNLKKLGAKIEWDKENNVVRTASGKVSLACPVNPENGKKELHVDMASCPDSICAMSVAACFADGDVYLENALVCRHKETDRIEVMKSELTKLGAEIEDGEDWILIHGKGGKNLHGGIVESFDDHRIAMALSVLGLALNDGECVEVKDAECCKVSFPGFFEKMSSIGAKFN